MAAVARSCVIEDQEMLETSMLPMMEMVGPLGSSPVADGPVVTPGEV